MTGPLTTDRIRQLIQDLFTGIAARVEGDLTLRDRLDRELAEEDHRFAAQSRERAQRYETERAALQAEYDRIRTQAGHEYRAHYSAASEEYTQALGAINDEFNSVSESARKEFEETHWMVVSYFDENAGGSPKLQFEQFEFNTASTREHLGGIAQELEQLHTDTVAILNRRRMWTEPELPTPDRLPDGTDALAELFMKAADDVRSGSTRLRRRKLPLVFSGLMPLVVFLLMTGALAGLAYAGIDPSWLKFRTAPPMAEWLGMLSGAGAVITLAVMGILFGILRSRCEDQYLHLVQALINARAAFAQWDRLSARELKKRKKEFDDWYGRLVDERDSRLKMAQDRLDRVMASATEKHTRELAQCHARYPALMDRLTKERDTRLAAAEAEYPPKLKKLDERYRWDTERLQKEHEQNLSTIRQRFELDWQHMARQWQTVISRTQNESAALQTSAQPQSQSWADLAFGHWTAPREIPSSVRLGEFALRLEDVEQGLPDDKRLLPAQREFHLPALVPFPEQASLLIKAPGSAARTAAVKLVQTTMLRLLTTLPPGKVRFTIIDPIGLGENFSAFMHLTDYDELLVTSRIWTEATHIEQRLTDLTGHMETVFQTYLRNEFRTIEEYNQFAGEVAEPYRILVIAGFPASFTEQAGRRLTSIMTSGPRCGVYTLMSVDPQLTMPPNFRLDQVTGEATCLTWTQNGFRYEDPTLAWLPFTAIEPPQPDEFSRIVKRVGDVSKDARRVEVSFERVAPRELWQQDSRSGIDIPLGRAGATKLQHLRLGRGTSQHVLVAGKTGSGKSTFMHILITNIALHYSPDEVEFFLIDFKKGVEFKTYAANQLPHARVIAIESDREFGLSVLERLDGILKERGDLFRDKGVQDIASFRNENPGQRMPRLLLLIDEFQEFFTEDDRMGQQAALLLDRLVRQGRAFGIHVLLGSQTLGGAYSLARSTLGQVAVRVALQCSEADAHLILSEENTAARLLTRPGEAIYNDANGLLEGNHPFQIAWLEDDRRDHFLSRIRALTKAQALHVAPPIVFEGNVPASPFHNPALVNLFQQPAPTAVPATVEAWLGEAVAIKPHTSVRFRRLAGSHLLIVGQAPLAARGMLSCIVLAAAAQLPLPLPADAFQCVDDDCGDSADSADHSVIPGLSLSGDTDETRDCLQESDLTEPDRDAPDLTHLMPPGGLKMDASMQDALAAMKSFSLSGLSFSANGPERNPLSEAEASPLHPATFYILNGELADNPGDSFWSGIAVCLPHESQIGGPRDAARLLRDLTAILDQRTAGNADQELPVFVVIDNLGRFRDLRKDDDDYSFGAGRSSAVTPARQFVRLLKDGPAVGMHVLIWADTFSNATRWMSSQTLRELEMRVAFQMSATDSSNFIDSPAAGKLGQNRALLFLEETGTLEKFRPYGPPGEEWLTTVRDHFVPVSSTSEAEAFEFAEATDDDFIPAAAEESSARASHPLQPATSLPSTAPADLKDNSVDACDDLSEWTIL